jgi:hypothetical protein
MSIYFKNKCGSFFSFTKTNVDLVHLLNKVLVLVGETSLYAWPEFESRTLYLFTLKVKF